MTEATITIEDILSSPEKVVKIVHIAGQLDESNIDEKIQEIYKVIEANPKNLNLIFDLENLEYMNSKSIGYLTDLYGKITETGGQVAIGQPKPNIADILQVVGLTQLIKTFPSVSEAKKYLTEGEAATATQPAATTAPTSTEAPAQPLEAQATSTPTATPEATAAPAAVPAPETPPAPPTAPAV